MRSLAAFLVLVVLLGGVVVAAELLTRGQVEAVVEAVAEEQLRSVADPGGTFDDVEVTVEGWALLGLLRSRFDAVTVTATDGVVDGLPVDSFEVVARGASPDARDVEQVAATIRADVAGAVARRLEPRAAEAVTGTARVTGPDRLGATVPLDLPVLGEVDVEVEVAVAVEAGGLVVRPVGAGVAGTRSAPAEVVAELLPGYRLPAAALPGGLELRSAALEQASARPVLVLDLGCEGACSLR